jgi:hypothetical protein
MKMPLLSVCENEYFSEVVNDHAILVKLPFIRFAKVDQKINKKPP